MTQPHIRVLPDPAAVAREAAELFVASAERAIAEHEVFTVVLAGGSTPRAMYELLAAEPFRSRVNWVQVEVFFGDERCVPPDDERSNYRMVKQTLLDRVPIPRDNVYRMRGEIDPNEAAKLYGLQLRDIFGDGGADLVYLGMGEDGHTASLFPRTAALDEQEHRCVANHVPHDYLPAGTAWRLTLTAPFLNRGRHVVVACTGADKAARIAEVLEGDEDPQRLPIQLIQPTSGEFTWLLDAAAAGM